MGGDVSAGSSHVVNGTVGVLCDATGAKRGEMTSGRAAGRSARGTSYLTGPAVTIRKNVSPMRLGSRRVLEGFVSVFLRRWSVW